MSKILLIDDDDDFRASVKATLEASGYEVVEAASGALGLQRLREHAPDLVILDVMLESLEEGYRVNEAIRFQDEYAAYRHVPIIMVSSIQETPAERIGAIGDELSGPDAYMTKPLDVAKFLKLVEGMTGQKSAR